MLYMYNYYFLNYYHNVEKVKIILRECCTRMAACEKYLINFNGEGLESSLLGGHPKCNSWDMLFPGDSPLIVKFIP